MPIIEEGVDICSPIPCHTDIPQIVVESYPDTAVTGEVAEIKWDIVKPPGTLEIESNTLLWSADPFDLNNEVAGSDDAPYTASFTVTTDSMIYFKIRTIINNRTFFSDLFVIVLTSTSSSSSSSNL